MVERDLRSEILNTLLTSPHRNLAGLQSMHLTLMAQDPRFYVHLASWYADQGVVRDHKEMFVAMLCTSRNEVHREVGLALLRRLPPYEVARVVDFVKGRLLRRCRPLSRKAGYSRPVARPTLINASLFGRARSALKLFVRQDTGGHQIPSRGDEAGNRVHEEATEPTGLFKNVPRSMRTEIKRYLQQREAEDHVFDRTTLTARQALKRLYAGLHIRPSSRAQAVLFDNDPPRDSLSFIVKQIAKMESPAEQARAIVEHRIPYRVASSVLKLMSPMTLAALVEVMSPQEVINNIQSLKRRGAFSNPEFCALIDVKLASAKKDARVSAYKAKVALQASGARGKLASALDSVTEAKLKDAGSITRDTALLIDKSGSMQRSIEVGKQLGAMISSICEADLFAYAFDTVAYLIESASPHLFNWERAMADLHAGGSTSCGISLELMCHKGQKVEQIVIVTDENENHPPFFKDSYQAYEKMFGIRPAVIIVKIGQASDRLEKVCFELGVAPNLFEFRGDYYSLPNLIPMLTYPSLADMVMEILDYPLPKRDHDSTIYVDQVEVNC